MWTRTRLTALLGLDHPIVQGPFGGGYSTAALTAAVSNAGGLGSFGAVDIAPEAMGDVVGSIAALTRRPFAVNLWVPIRGEERVISDDAYAAAVARLQPFYEQAKVSPPTRPARFGQVFDDQVAALLEARPPVLSVVMGVPDAAILDEARARGIITLGTATTVAEAVALADAGIDAVVASGSDAGGHRGAFLLPVESSLVGTMSLVPQVATAVGVPVIAAGGITDARAIAAALALGADGVQIGTAFLAAHESGAPEAHKALLGTDAARITRLTRAFSGRYARGIENDMMRILDALPGEVLPYPAQNSLTVPIRRAAAVADRVDRLGLWAGQAAALARRLPAAEIVERLLAETDEVLRHGRLAARER